MGDHLDYEEGPWTMRRGLGPPQDHTGECSGSVVLDGIKVGHV